MENLLDLNSVTKYYKEFTLNNVSFTITAGFNVGMNGQNDANKNN